MQYKNAKIAYVLKIFYATFAFLVFIIAMHGVKSLIASNIEVVFSKKGLDLKGGKRKWSGVTISPPLGLVRYSFQADITSEEEVFLKSHSPRNQ